MSQLIQQRVIVKKTDGDFAWVVVADGSGCGSCSSKKTCGSANLLKPLIDANTKSKNLKVINKLNAQAGDEVMLELASSDLLKGTFLAYLLPLVTLFVFALLGKYFFGEAGSALLGITGLFAGLYWVKNIVEGISGKQMIEPEMTSFAAHADTNNVNVKAIQPYS